MFEIGFCAPKAWKKWKAEELEKKIGFGAEKCGLQAKNVLK